MFGISLNSSISIQSNGERVIYMRSSFFSKVLLRYFFQKPSFYTTYYGEFYICDHPVYNRCTLYRIDERGLAVIQQRFDPSTKSTYWTEIDPWLTDVLYLNPGFKKFFDERSLKPNNGLFPTITVRQIMWSLRMKPIPKERWETVFDKRDI